MIDEDTWLKAEQNQLIRERRARVKSGMITIRSKPNVMVKDENSGKWKFPPIPCLSRKFT